MKRVPHQILDEQIRQSSGSIAILSDESLATLLASPPTDPLLIAKLRGEGFVRCWLYPRHCPTALTASLRAKENKLLNARFKEHVLPLRRVNAPTESTRKHEIPDMRFSTDAEQEAWRYMSRRIQDFLDCDGIFPLAIGNPAFAAVAVPFTLQPVEAETEKIRDRSGRILTEWSRLAAAMENDGHLDLGAKILVDFGATQPEPEGGSLLLPLILAGESRKGRVIGEYAPLDLLATGAIKYGRLAEIDGFKEKSALARRLGVRVFAAPTVPFLNSGLSLPESLRRVAAEMERHGLFEMDLRKAVNRFQELERELSEGMLPLKEAEHRLRRYEKVFLHATRASRDREEAMEQLALAKYLHVAVANHSGDPVRARRYTAEAERLGYEIADPLKYVKKVADQVVMHTDAGDLDQAEALGRKLLQYAHRPDLQADVSQRNRCRMIACGLLGGQPLLQKSLFAPRLARESLALLEQSLALANRCDDKGADVCRDSVQVVLWHAFHAPEKMGAAYRHSLRQLQVYPKNTHSVSLAYLNRIRFLGAYRLLLKRNAVQKGFQNWELPAETVAHSVWLLAAALKYRGALYAAADLPSKSQADFEHSWQLLERVSAPLLRLIAATVAAQAACSLGRFDRNAASEWLDRAERLLTRCWLFPQNGYIAPAEWKRAVQELRSQKRLPPHVQPQRFFPY
ncbi:MAG: hypothetical protein HY360_25875 [Verrucomicrobia bacterium]|nr:hypothetical protein [Verrucomicrobiota bacterium]